MALILFVRHGQPDWLFADRLGLRGAQRNLMCLTARGVSQVEGMAVNPLLEGAELILSSPYTRALHSAAIISWFRDHLSVSGLARAGGAQPARVDC
jgi:broad specificity phosphatase PhoE